ncbi:MAG: NAD(P)H-hydrate dehydratase [Ilumatobacteraceae bacterium]|nr:NAD(P)H-hydrate dehydratase [Ilumatobacteraceae bacterium]
MPYLTTESHKYSRGHVLIIGGYPMAGAARLAARAAMRVGSGMVTVAVPPHGVNAYVSAMEYAIVLPLLETDPLIDIVRQRKISAILLGPGLGVSDLTRSRVLEALQCGVPIVLDADALTSFSNDPEELFGSIIGPCIITPHEGEFSRLFNLDGPKVERAQQAAHISHSTVVLKGSSTIIASTEGSPIINTNAPASLSTAGTGDVLAGIIVSLIAQGMPLFDAAAAATWIHAEAARKFSVGLIAQDLPDLLLAVIRELHVSN